MIRWYSFLLVCLLVAATIFNAVAAVDDEEEPTVESVSTTVKNSETDVEEESSVNESNVDESYPHCHVDTINGHPAYLCERNIDGESKQFAFLTTEDGSFHCGDFAGGKINGAAYSMYYNENGSPSHWCGDYVDSRIHGHGSYHIFDLRTMEIGNFGNGLRNGEMVVYSIDRDQMARSFNKNGKCRSAIWYNRSGFETRRDPYSCALQ